jgi:hypothetical protein
MPGAASATAHVSARARPTNRETPRRMHPISAAAPLHFRDFL